MLQPESGRFPFLRALNHKPINSQPGKVSHAAGMTAEHRKTSWDISSGLEWVMGYGGFRGTSTQTLSRKA